MLGQVSLLAYHRKVKLQKRDLARIGIKISCQALRTRDSKYYWYGNRDPKSLSTKWGGDIDCDVENPVSGGRS